MRKPLLAGTATMSLALAAALAATPTLASSAQAAVITFETAPPGANFTGPVTENGFTYSRLSGALFVDTAGNPGKDMEGQSGASNGGGGVLDITAASGGPAAFTYSGLDYAAFDSRGIGSQTLRVTGLLGGSTVGTDTYTLANTNVSVPTYSNWTSELASNLSGKTIDDLRIALNGSNDVIPSVSFWQAVDNVVLTPASTVPEPASLALLGSGLLGLGLTARRRRA